MEGTLIDNVQIVLTVGTTPEELRRIADLIEERPNELIDDANIWADPEGKNRNQTIGVRFVNHSK